MHYLSVLGMTLWQGNSTTVAISSGSLVLYNTVRFMAQVFIFLSFFVFSFGLVWFGWVCIITALRGFWSPPCLTDLPWNFSEAKEVHEAWRRKWGLEHLEWQLSFLPTVHWSPLVLWCHDAHNCRKTSIIHLHTPSICLKMGSVEAFAKKVINGYE